MLLTLLSAPAARRAGQAGCNICTCGVKGCIVMPDSYQQKDLQTDCHLIL